ncbi:MAG: adenylate/guanylate cyclase domain-containing protein [Planctomycetota bacterium]|nr:adenylate/guanylate cyclase domain-containing protein [Planctomycetota bacterium]
MLNIRIRNDNQSEDITLSEGSLSMGRVEEPGANRTVINDRYVSRNQLTIEELPNETVRINNHGNKITFSDGTAAEKGETIEVNVPVGITVGFTTLEITSKIDLEPKEVFQTIARPIKGTPDAQTLSPVFVGQGAPSAAKLTQVFETLISVQRSAAGSSEFYRDTAQAVVQLVGLDRGMVLLRSGDGWDTAGAYTESPDHGTTFSTSILKRVLADERTFFEALADDNQAASLATVEAVVASPIFNASEEIVGVVYGSRDTRADSTSGGIQPLQAQIVQILAAAVSAGLARVDQEKEASRLKVQFEEFVSPEIARELQRNPALLEGQDREVTCLFCDLRSFSRISEILGARETYLLMNDVMDHLTKRVLEYQGVIINYAGDGLAAMWNAPTDQPDHANLACLTALAMQSEMAQLNDNWQDKTEIPLRIGIGINTGIAQVGNAGSKQRIKYGPMGHAVNVASRVEGATKYLGIPVLLTEQTLNKMTATMATRRLCQVRVIGIKEPVSLFELFGEQAEDNWSQLRDGYEQALSLSEESRCDEALQILNQLLKETSGLDDRPTLLLSSRLAEEDWDPVLQLEGK